MVRIGLVGCGKITQFRHAPECAENNQIEIGGFFDINVTRAQELVDTYGGKAYATYAELLNDTAIDAVIISTSNKFHAPMTIEALKAGKHVLCEKPISISIAEAEAMVDQAKESGKFLMIAHNQRFDAIHQKAKQILKSGEMGKILSFKTVFGHGGPENWGVDKGAHTWFFKKGEAFLGSMGDVGVHKADLIRWMIEDEISEVTALVTAIDKKDEKGDLIQIDDNAICILKSQKGIIGTLESSWTYYGEVDSSTTLYCTEGIMKVKHLPQYALEIIKKDGELITYKIPENQNSGIVNSFVASIENGVEPEISGEEGLKALQIVLACMESSQRGEKVILN